MRKIGILFIAVLSIGSAFGQQKIGNNPTSINSNAALEIESTDKGLLIPRLALTSTSSASPLSAFVAGMMVYNTATAGDVTPGFYVSTGSSWSKIDNQTSTTLYSSNGSLSGNRTVAQGTNTLGFTSTASTGTSHFTVDGTTFNVDAVNNRIGIGTATPTQTLDVNGNARFVNGALISPILTTGTWIDLPTTGPSGIGSGGAGANPWVAYVASGGQWFTNAVVGDIAYRNTSGKMLWGNTSGSAAMALTSDRLGIGNIAPTERLDVSGNVKFSGALMPNNTAGTSGQVLTSAGAGAAPTWTTIASNTGSTSVILNAGSFERAALTGDVTAAQNSNALTIANDAVTYAKMQNVSANNRLLGRATTGAGDVEEISLGTGLSFTGTTLNAATASTIYNADGTISGNRNVDMGTNKLSFSSTATLGTSHFIVDGPTLNVDAVNNRLGIGTFAPSAILHTTNNSTTLTNLVENTLATNYAMTGFKASAREYRVGTGGATESTYGVGNSFFIFDATANSMRLVVNSSGSVGIGTAAPATEFDMPSGVMKVGTTASYHVRTGAGYIDFYDNAGVKTTNIAQNNTNGDLYINNLVTGKNTLLNVSNSGRVGIGNATPSEKLDVTGNIRFSGALMPNNTAGTAGQVLTSAGAGAVPTWTTPASASTLYAADGSLAGDRIVSMATKTLNFTSTATTGTSHFAVDGTTFNVDAVNNRVGIGTAAPLNTLDVIGTLRVTGVTNLATTALNNSPLYFRSDANHGLIYNGTADGPRLFGFGGGFLGTQNGTNALYWNSSGNVGIGTTTPNAPLQFANSIGRKVVLFEIANNDHQIYGLGIDNNILKYQVENTTANHVFYAGTSTTTSNELVRITGTGRVGIGAAAPSEALQVTGNVRFSGALMPNNTAGTTGQVLTSAGAGAAPTWTTISGITSIYSGDGTLSGNRTVSQGTNNLAFTSTATTGTSHFTVDGTTLNVNAVNNRVGVGVAAPNSTLSVSGRSQFGDNTLSSNDANDDVYIEKNGSYTQLHMFNDDLTNTDINAYISQNRTGSNSHGGTGSTTPGFNIWTSSAHPIRFSTSSAERMIISSTGNIGLGTMSPSERLDVSGNIRFSGALMPNNTAGTSGQVLTSAGAGAVPTWTTLPTTTTLYSADGSIPASTTRAVTFGSASNLNFDANTLYINGDNNRVGIGTNSPNFPLHVVSPGADAVRIEGNSAATGVAGASTLILVNTNSTNNNYSSITSRNSAGGYGSSIEFLNESSGASGSVRFVTNNNGTITEKMRVAPNGNVGIGTSNPTKMLSVVNGSISPAVGNSEDAGVYFPANPGGGSNDEAFIRYYVESGENTKLVIGNSNDTDDDISFIQNGGERLTIVNTNVGVGTTAPTVKLDVDGGILARGNNSISNQGAHLQWNRSATEGETWLLNQKGNGSVNSGIRFGSVTTANAVTEWARFMDNGRFGIAQPNPQAQLHVGGSTITEGMMSIYGSTSIGAQGLHLAWNRSGGSGESYIINQRGAGGGGIRFGTSDQSNNVTELARIENNGNFGIGHTSPSHPLHMGSGAHVTAAGTWTNASDMRLKKNIVDSKYGLSEVLKLRSVDYEMKASGEKQVGFVAQEVKKVIPEVVSGNENSDVMMGISYGNLVPVLVNAIKEQQAQIEKLQKELEAVKLEMEKKK